MASTGSIIVNVYTTNARIPVEGATVLFWQQNPPETLLGLRITDSSGITAPLSVPTADPSFSQSPDPQERPWTGLNIRIEHPAFERLILEGVQVFPDITTIQNASLLPMDALDPEQNSQQEEIFTPQPVSEGSL